MALKRAFVIKLLILCLASIQLFKIQTSTVLENSKFNGLVTFKNLTVFNNSKFNRIKF